MSHDKLPSNVIRFPQERIAEADASPETESIPRSDSDPNTLENYQVLWMIDITKYYMGISEELSAAVEELWHRAAADLASGLTMEDLEPKYKELLELIAEKYQS